MAEGDPKSAPARLHNLDAGWSSTRTPAAPWAPEGAESDEPIVHRIVESEESARQRSSAPPPAVTPSSAPAEGAPAPRLARATVRMTRPELASGSGSAPPEAQSQPVRTLPLGAQLPPVSAAPIVDVGPPAPAPATPPANAGPRNAGGMPSTTLIIATPASVVATQASLVASQASLVASQTPKGAPPASAVATNLAPLPVPAPSEPPPAAHGLVHVSREERWHGPPGGTPAPSVPPRPQLPPGPNPLDPRLVLITEPESARAVAFRLLRDTLVSKELPRVLAVAGSAPHDGATTCAINVALALAEHPDTHVLLMDGNFAAPALARIFSMDGFGPANDALTPLKLAALMTRFHVAAIVKRNAETPPRFDKVRYQRILEHLASQGYDHIVIDAGALRPGSSAAQLVTVADATLLAVRAGRTTARTLRRASGQIPPGRAIGVTLVDDEE